MTISTRKWVVSISISVLVFVLASCQLQKNLFAPQQTVVGVDGNHLRGVYVTDAGMLCLWDPEAFSEVHDFDSWIDELLSESDIQSHIDAGHFLPVNTGTDGAFLIEVRVGWSESTEELSERERAYLTSESGTYYFVSHGALAVSGIEYVEAVPGDAVGVLNLSPGEYAVTVNQIAWWDEPGMTDNEGAAVDGALPDFIVLVNPSPTGLQAQ